MEQVTENFVWAVYINAFSWIRLMQTSHIRLTVHVLFVFSDIKYVKVSMQCNDTIYVTK